MMIALGERSTYNFSVVRAFSLKIPTLIMYTYPFMDRVFRFVEIQNSEKYTSD